LVTRQESASDQRGLALTLAPERVAIVNSNRSSVQASLVKILGWLFAGELETVHCALELLHPLFAAQGK